MSSCVRVVMSGAVDLSIEPRLLVPLSFFRKSSVRTGIAGWLPAGFCEGGRCLVGRGGGTDAGTNVGASGCNRVSCPPKDLPPATVLSCEAEFGFGRLSEEGPTPPPRPRLRFLGLRLSELFCVRIVLVASGMVDEVARSAMAEKECWVAFSSDARGLM
jgi:hypothetical protein